MTLPVVEAARAVTPSWLAAIRDEIAAQLDPDIEGLLVSVVVDTTAVLVAVEKLVLVPTWREGGTLFDKTERAALAWAETVTRVAETGVPDADHEAAAAVFDQKQLADLTIAIGLMNAYNRLAVSFRNPPAAAKQ